MENLRISKKYCNFASKIEGKDKSYVNIYDSNPG